MKKKRLEMFRKYCNTASSPQGTGKKIPNNWTSNSKALVDLAMLT